MTKRRSRRTINIEKVAGVLTLDQLTRFIINCDNEINYKHEGFNEVDFIESMFAWYDTPEGVDYWCDIAISIDDYLGIAY